MVRPGPNPSQMQKVLKPKDCCFTSAALMFFVIATVLAVILGS